MKKFLIAVYGCLLLLLAATTFVEQTYSTDFVEKHVYHTIWFCCLWGALAAMTVVVLVRLRLWRHLPTLLLHGSFLVILAGAMTTFLCGRKGYVHLTVGSEVNCFLEQDGRQVVELPFTLRLDSFRIEYYPGTDAPADYISYIHGETPVSMNRILSRQGFRFYQSSFDEDMQGSWLTVNYDPWGIGVTYSGYLLLGVSMLWMLVSRGGEFRRLLRHPLLKKGGMFVLLLLCLGSGVHAQKRSLPALARKQADSLARKQVIYNDRVVPFNTLARDFVLKLTGKPSYGGMTPEQVIGGWLLRPEVWQNEPMIYLKNEALRRLLHLETPYACLADLFDGEKYRLQKFWKGKQDHHQKMTSLEKAIVEADEKVGLILMLQNGTLIRPLPKDGSVEPVSDTKIQAELLYNRIPFSKLLFMFNLTVGMLAFFRLLYRGLRRSSALSDSSGRIVALSFSSRLADTFFPFSLYALRVWPEVVHRWANTVGQRIRNDAVHGIVCAVPGLSVSAALPVYGAFRLFAVRFCLASVLFGTDESPNHSLDARACFSMAQYACVVDNDVLCFVCLYDAERHTGIVSSPFSPDVDAARPIAALSCRFLFGSRYFSGCGLGQCFLGAILGLGPEGSMGADYLYGLWSGVPCAQPAHFPQAVILPHLYDCRFSDSPDDLFWGELHPWRNA